MDRIGLALSGGAARCIAHLGVLEVLSNEDIPVDVISGTSGGAVVGALYASGRYSLSDLIRHIGEIGWWEVTRPVLSRDGFFSSDRIGRYVTGLIGEANFEDLKIPLAVVATDLLSGQKRVLRQGLVARAVQASCSLPVIFRPTDWNGAALVDGGFVSQIPVRAARQDLAADFVIAIDVNYGGMTGAPPLRNSIQIAIHMASLWARKNAEEEGREADYLIRVNVAGISLTGLHQRQELLQRGHKAAGEALTGLRDRLRERGLSP